MPLTPLPAHVQAPSDLQQINGLLSRQLTKPFTSPLGAPALSVEQQTAGPGKL